MTRALLESPAQPPIENPVRGLIFVAQGWRIAPTLGKWPRCIPPRCPAHAGRRERSKRERVYSCCVLFTLRHLPSLQDDGLTQSRSINPATSLLAPRHLSDCTKLHKLLQTCTKLNKPFHPPGGDIHFPSSRLRHQLARGAAT
jgi:hypothetical protein